MTTYKFIEPPPLYQWSGGLFDSQPSASGPPLMEVQTKPVLIAEGIVIVDCRDITTDMKRSIYGHINHPRSKDNNIRCLHGRLTVENIRLSKWCLDLLPGVKRCPQSVLEVLIDSHGHRHNPIHLVTTQVFLISKAADNMLNSNVLHIWTTPGRIIGIKKSSWWLDCWVDVRDLINFPSFWEPGIRRDDRTPNLITRLWYWITETRD